MAWEDVDVPAKATGGWQDVPLEKPPPSLMRRVTDAMLTQPETALALASGTVAPVVGGLAGLAAAALPGEFGQGGRVSERVTNALTYEPRSQGAQMQVKAVSYPFEKLAEGADAVGGRVVDKTGSPAAGTAVNTAIQALPMALTPGLRRAGPIRPGGDPTLRRNVDAAKEAGFVMVPHEAGSGFLAKTAAGLAGEPKLAKLVSTKNQVTIRRMIAEDLGLPPDTVLDRATIARVRQEAGAVHEEVRHLGQIAADQEYGAALQRIVERHEGAERSFPTGRQDPVYGLVESLNQPSFNASAAVDKIKLLREDADAAFRSRDRRMGRANREAALAIEDAIDRHLGRLEQASAPRPPFNPGAARGALPSPRGTPVLPGAATGTSVAAPPGNAVAPRGTSVAVPGGEVGFPGGEITAPGTLPPRAPGFERDITPMPEAPAAPRVTSELVTRWREARTRIAKAYAADRALNETTGDINAQAYATDLKNQKPLSGNALSVAEFGRAFPRSSLKPPAGHSGASAWDAALGGLSGEWKLGLLRPAARQAIASRLGQNFVGPSNWTATELARQIQAMRGAGVAESAQGQRED